MPRKRYERAAELTSRREWLEARSTEELLQALDPLKASGSGLVITGGGKSLVRQILVERGVSDKYTPVTVKKVAKSPPQKDGDRNDRG